MKRPPSFSFDAGTMVSNRLSGASPLRLAIIPCHQGTSRAYDTALILQVMIAQPAVEIQNPRAPTFLGKNRRNVPLRGPGLNFKENKEKKTENVLPALLQKLVGEFFFDFSQGNFEN